MHFLKLSRFFLWVTPFLYMTYITLPFLNGYGCDFTFEHKGKISDEIGRCNDGVLTVYTKNHIDGTSFLTKLRWGYLKNKIYTHQIENKSLDNSKVPYGPTALYIEQSLSIAFINRSYQRKDEYIIYFKYPVPTIYNNDVKGVLGFY